MHCLYLGCIIFILSTLDLYTTNYCSYFKSWFSELRLTRLAMHCSSNTAVFQSF